MVASESGTQGNLRVYAFSTFFYSKLSKDGPTHSSWDRWMRRGNIAFFDYDLILIPIHLGNHWTLTVRFSIALSLTLIRSSSNF